MPDDLPNLRRLLAVVARLRAPDGCPWDRVQTAASMAPHLLEEAYEAVAAIESGDAAAIRDELGDVLTNVCLIAQISADGGGFDSEAVAGGVADKLVRRHPHVFGDRTAANADAAFAGWERSKRREGRDGQPRGLLAGVPAALPALLRAFRIGEKAARVGFDWPDRSGPRAKIDEELAELDAAVASGENAAIAHELGDLLFSVANLARHLGVNPEMALRAAADRFTRRFARVEADLGPDVAAHSLAEMEAAWQRAKAEEG